MNHSHVTPTASSAPDAPGVDEHRDPKVAVRSSNWTAGRVAAVVVGSLLGLVGLALLTGAGIGLWADLTQREGGYVTTDAHDFSTSGSALVTKQTELGSAGTGWLYAPDLLGKVRIRVTPASASRPLFVGIGRTADVERYLAGVNRTVINDFFSANTKTIAGGTAKSEPATQDFWVASTRGSGPKTLVWDPADGRWTVVVMNADARAGVDVKADLGARLPDLLWIAIGLLVAGAVFIAGGVLLIVGAIRRSRPSPAAT